MKFIPLLIAILLCVSSAFADDVPASDASAAPITATDIAHIQAQEFSRALVQLKLEEVAIQHARPLDNDKLTLNRTQQKAVEQELIKLTLASLEWELQRISVRYRSTHPKMVQLQQEIEQTKSLLSSSH
jgi:Na+-translocating ferredoxin:NAD+ oxidoreductase RnfD subunit